MVQVDVFGGQSRLVEIGRSFQKTIYLDGFKKRQFLVNSEKTLREEKDLKNEYGIQSSLTNAIQKDIVRATQTITEEVILHQTAATSTGAPVVVDPLDLKRLIKYDGIIITGVQIVTDLEIRADAMSNARDLPTAFQDLLSPKYLTQTYEIIPASYSGTPIAKIKLRTATAGYSLGSLRDDITQRTSQTDMATTTYRFTEYWCPETTQEQNPSTHIFNPNVDDTLTANFNFYIPTIAGPDGIQIDPVNHIFSWNMTISLSEDANAVVTLDMMVYPTDNSLD